MRLYMPKKRKSLISKKRTFQTSKRQKRLIKILENKYNEIKKDNPNLSEKEIDRLFVRAHNEDKVNKYKSKKARVLKKADKRKKTCMKYPVLEYGNSKSIRAISGGAVSPR